MCIFFKANSRNDLTEKSNADTSKTGVVFRSKSSNTIQASKDNRSSTNSTANLKHSKSFSSVSQSNKSTNLNLDDFNKRSAFLSSKGFKSSTNLALFAKTHDNEKETKFDYDELFDPSIVFLASYRCRYYDHKRCIRKGI